MKIDIGADVARDLKKMTSPSALKEVKNRVGHIYKKSIEKQNERSANPDGSPRKKLSARHEQAKEKIGARPVPDFEYTGRAKQSFGFENTSEGIRFSYSDAKAAEYMYDNELGDLEYLKRRQSPLERDSESAPQRENIRKTEKAILEHLMQDRTVKVTN